MRNHAQSDEAEEINMTPMLDIVFIMLIFFIVTAVFVKESGVEIAKPDAASAVHKPQTAVIIGITDADQVWVNRKKVEIKALRTVLERLLAENPRGEVVIQADREAKSGLTMQVMEAARQAGAPNVSLSANVR